MLVFNIRDGFANNSSSSHSIIFLKEPVNGIEDDDWGDFGRDTFTLYSKNAVMRYLAAILSENLSRLSVHDDYIECVVRNWVSEVGNEEIGYVDHQSEFYCPLSYDERGINKLFFDQLKELLLSNNVIILGGNDEGGIHPLLGDMLAKGKKADFDEEGEYRLVGKWDEKYKYWTLFNRDNGLKIRCILSTNGGRETVVPVQASTPDLVDVKITQYCSFGCTYCYMGSTKQGIHVPYKELEHIVWELSEQQVLEIAYGGGEPTEHPDFLRLLYCTREHRIVPNFTTRNLAWLKMNIGDISSVIGSCAVSIDDPYEVKNIATIRDYHNLQDYKICAQYVLGVNRNLSRVVEKCCELKVPLTLLGYKTTGRGGEHEPLDYSDWLQVVKQAIAGYQWCKIGIDTALVKQSGDMLSASNLPKWLYHKDEGVFSWYINAVDKEMGASSYEETKTYKEISEFMDRYTEYGNAYGSKR